MDEELRQLDHAIANARRLATEALDALAAPQSVLRDAAADYVESIARHGVDASRRASIEVVARLSDDDLAELRLWADEQIVSARSRVEQDIASCDFWISETSGLSPADVNAYGVALMPRPRDPRNGIPLALARLFERYLQPLRTGLAAIGLGFPRNEANGRHEAALARAWRAYRESAIECIAKWADVDERYRASAARFQEMRWERAGQVDAADLEARRSASNDRAAARELLEEASAAGSPDADGLSTEDHDPVEGAFVRSGSETLIPTPS